MLLLAITGNQGKEGTGLQLSNYNFDPQIAFMIANIPPTLNSTTMSRWDYAHANHKELNRQIYGDELAEHVDQHYRESIDRSWFPDYGRTPWKIGIYAGSNAANWRVSGKRWREKGTRRT